MKPKPKRSAAAAQPQRRFPGAVAIVLAVAVVAAGAYWWNNGRAAGTLPAAANATNSPALAATYYDWMFDHAFLAVPTQEFVGKFLMSFREFPQRQKAASFNLDEIMEKMKEAHSK